MKNNLFKKSMSVFLSILMLLTCWVWVAPTEAEAASVVSYPLSVQVNNQTKLTNGGNIQVYYYEVNSDGTLNTSSLLQYNFVNSLTKDKGATPTYTGTIPGFPVKIAVTVANYGWGTDKMGVKVVTVGNKTIFNDNYTIQDNQTINWELGKTLGSWNPSGVWENPSWTASATMSGGQTVQVPTYGSKSVSLSTKAAWTDQYGVAWPQANVSYSTSASGVSLSQSSGTLTGVTASSAAVSNFGNDSNSKTITVTASGAGKTQTANFTLKAPSKELTYENLFYLTDWAFSDSVASSNSSLGAVKPDLSKGTITVNTTGTEVYSTYGSAANHYSIPVKGNTEYIFEAKMNLDAGTQGQMFVFFYDANGNGVSGAGYNGGTTSQPHIGIYPSSNGLQQIKFTTPANCTKMAFRFGATTSGTTATYSDIRFYETSRQAIVDAAKAQGINRVVYNYNDPIATSTVPSMTRPGYTFDGWYVKDVDNDGNGAFDPLTNFVDGAYKMQRSFAIYSDWLPVDVNYENLFSLADWYNATNGATSNRGGAITADLDEGTLSIECPSGSSSADNNYVPWNYDITIEKNTDYVFEYDADIEAGGMQVHLFLNQGKDVTGSWGTFPSNAYIYAPTTHGKIEFNSGDYDNINIRLGTVQNVGITNTFKNIRLYKKSRATDLDLDNWQEEYRINAPTKGSDLYTPVREGYEFGGWYYDEACTNPVGVNDTFTKSTTVYSKWTVNSFTVTWKDENGNIIETDNDVAYGSTPTYNGSELTKNFDPEKHYAFCGWVSEANGNTYTDDSLPAVTGNVTYKAQFTATAHSLPESWTDSDDTNHYKSCGVCGYTAEEAHALEKQEYENTATCGKDGISYYNKYCPICEKIYGNGSEPSSATGVHSFTNYVPNGDATCTSDGTKTAKCDNCTETKTVVDEGSATGHKYTEKVTDPTCTEGGYTTYTCACGAKYTDNETEAKGHSWDDGVIDPKPTCNDEGTKTYTCGTCGTTKTEVVEAKGHTSGEENIENEVPATCTVDGSYDKVVRCTDCNAIITSSTVVVPAKGHTAGDVVVENEVAATCTKDGSYDNATYCTVCDVQTSRETITVKSEGHKYTSKVTAPTCTVDGYTTYTCSVCGDTYNANTVPATGHTYETAVTAPTCTEDGYTTYTCACGYSYTSDEVAATGHSYTSAETKAPTCTEAGIMTYTCACGDTYTEEIAANGHTLTSVEAKAPTCTEAGYEAYEYCSACDYTTYAEVAATGHSYTSAETKAPTCTETGVMTYTCACGDTYTEEIAANGHALTSVEAKAPTCTEAGYEAYEFCSACDYTTYNAVEATGHTAGAVVVENSTPATCTVDGSHQDVTYCTVCGAETSRETVVDTAPGHTDGDAVVENKVAPTCIKDGSYDNVTYCTVCGIETSRDTVVDPATGVHVYGDWTSVDGNSHERVCIADKYCTATETVVHNWTGWEADPENNADDKGTMKNTCSDCGYIWTSKCTYEVVVDIDSTCYSNGYTTYKCKECANGYTVEKELVAHTAGNAVTENFKDSTCYAEGSYDSVVYCSVCAKAGYTKEISRETKKIEMKAHTAGEAVRENEVDSTCYADGSYDEVVYCSVCEDANIKEELSRDKKTIEKKAHTDGDAVVENKVDSTCSEEGSYDEVVYCSVCAKANIVKELSRVEKTIGKKAHTEGEAVIENNVDPDCENAGSYDTVVYCSVCKAELDRVETTVDALGHTEGKAVIENNVDPDCENAGSYDTVVYCSVCGDELSREAITVGELGHKAGEAVIENEVAADCENNGSYDTVVYCSVCGDELSRETTTVETTGHDYKSVVTAPTCTEAGYTTYTCSKCGDAYEADEVDALGHTAGEAVVENEKEATCISAYTYDSVVYCSVCKEEISRETISEGEVSGHVEVSLEGAPATCEIDGLTEGVMCSVCETVLVEQTVIPATGHNISDVPYLTTAPTCTQGRTEYFKCKNCDLVKTVVEENTVPGPHHSVIVVEDIKATCEKNGYYATYCTACGTNVEVEVILATGHVDEDHDGVCDIFGCGGTVELPDGSSVCKCICHKESGFGKFLYKIVRFFWKLFGIGKSCACGNVHY